MSDNEKQVAEVQNKIREAIIELRDVSGSYRELEIAGLRLQEAVILLDHVHYDKQD